VTYGLYITHPEVVLDENLPPTRWHLSPRGRDRSSAFALSDAMRSIRLMIVSPETKTMEMAELLAASGAERITGADFHENERPVTGLLPPDEFEARMNALYAEPLASAGGWEPLAATTERIVAATRDAARRHADSAPLAFIGHGTVGTALKCALAGRTATRHEDQRLVAEPSGGNLFAFSLPEMALLTDWIAMESFELSRIHVRSTRR
jgi:broad specificity phosphatase PhoE